MSDPVKVFVSYSWDSSEHSERVRALVDRLIEDGIDCVLDKYLERPPRQGWPTWMREEVESADFVLVICSEGYRRKAQGEPSGGGAGVRFESVQILQQLYDQRMWNERFVPILLTDEDEVWEPLRPYHHFKGHSEEGYEDLYRLLTNQPALVRPKLGAVKVLPPKNAPAADLAPVVLRETPLIERPPWASAAGEDEFGRWAEFRVSEVVQRMRWIPPGQFRMGSPETEAGRWPDEGPRHLVALTEGFWLGDTPCTQALWSAVMGWNPSFFKSLERPVEMVSWDYCHDFLVRLNARFPGLELRLPLEAEWEFACRAGTETSTYAGDLKILGERNAPLLDGIAWYGGNSGVGYDLADGEDSSDWKEKQYGHKKAGTRIVKQKRPNAWGLYDMLGNVWEWCQDWHGSYSAEEATDPAGPDVGSLRVIRGGSWYFDARSVRAAARSSRFPVYRNVNLGFRLARSK